MWWCTTAHQQLCEDAWSWWSECEGGNELLRVGLNLGDACTFRMIRTNLCWSTPHWCERKKKQTYALRWIWPSTMALSALCTCWGFWFPNWGLRIDKRIWPSFHIECRGLAHELGLWDPSLELLKGFRCWVSGVNGIGVRKMCRWRWTLRSPQILSAVHVLRILGCELQFRFGRECVWRIRVNVRGVSAKKHLFLLVCRFWVLLHMWSG